MSYLSALDRALKVTARLISRRKPKRRATSSDLQPKPVEPPLAAIPAAEIVPPVRPLPVVGATSWLPYPSVLPTIVRESLAEGLITEEEAMSLAEVFPRRAA